MSKKLIIDICPRLLNRWKTNKLISQVVTITKRDINKVTNKLTIFCPDANHNCFCDKRVRKDPKSILVGRGKDLTQ